MTSIVSNRVFLIKDPNEILQDKIHELIEENKKENEKITTIPAVIPGRKYKSHTGSSNFSNKGKYFIPKFYI